MRIAKINLAVAMAKKGYNFKRLSEACGLSQATLCNLNLGKECKPRTLVKIAGALDVNPEDIIEQKE